MADQIPIDFSLEPSNARDDLVFGPSIEAAIATIDQWPNWIAPIVILAGPTGAGKTHLANIWQHHAKAERVHLSDDLQDLIKVAQASPILLEDIDQHDLDEDKLFHLVNSVKQAQSSLLITSRSWPQTWAIQLADLKSRIQAATIIEIGEPDEMLLTQVIMKLFADRQIEIDMRTVNYMVMRMERSLAVAQKIVARMDEVALSQKIAVNRTLAGQILAEFENQTSVTTS